MPNYSINILINAKFHLGSFKRDSNIEMSSYISGSRYLLYIINLAHSIFRFQKSQIFLQLLSKNRGLTLFVLRPDLASSRYRAKAFVSKWIPGVISNFSFVSRYYVKRHFARLVRVPDAFVFLPTMGHDSYPANEGQVTRTPSIFLASTAGDVFGAYAIPSNSESSGAAKFLYDISLSSIKAGLHREMFIFMNFLQDALTSGMINYWDLRANLKQNMFLNLIKYNPFFSLLNKEMFLIKRRFTYLTFFLFDKVLDLLTLTYKKFSMSIFLKRGVSKEAIFRIFPLSIFKSVAVVEKFAILKFAKHKRLFFRVFQRC